MKFTYVLLGCLFSSLLLVGCKSAPEPVGTVMVANSGVVGNPLPPQRMAPAGQEHVQLPRGKIVLSPDIRPELPRVRYQGMGKETVFNQDLRLLMSEDTADVQARVVTDGNADLLIQTLPEFVQIDKFGNYYRLSCSVKIGILPACGNPVFSVRTFELPSLPRQLTEAAAKKQYLAAARKKISPYLKGELNRIVMEKFAVANVDLHLTGDSGSLVRTGEFLRQTPGVVECRLVGQDPKNFTCTYRVVYLKEFFHDGLFNVLNARLKCF